MEIIKIGKDGKPEIKKPSIQEIIEMAMGKKDQQNGKKK